MAQLPDPCRISPEQHIGQMGRAEATVAAIDGGERLAGGFGDIHCR